mgnify:CR=1 FL=1
MQIHFISWKCRYIQVELQNLETLNKALGKRAVLTTVQTTFMNDNAKVNAAYSYQKSQQADSFCIVHEYKLQLSSWVTDLKKNIIKAESGD